MNINSQGTWLGYIALWESFSQGFAQPPLELQWSAGPTPALTQRVMRLWNPLGVATKIRRRWDDNENRTPSLTIACVGTGNLLRVLLIRGRLKNLQRGLQVSCFWDSWMDRHCIWSYFLGRLSLVIILSVLFCSHQTCNDNCPL